MSLRTRLDLAAFLVILFYFVFASDVVCVKRTRINTFIHYFNSGSCRLLVFKSCHNNFYDNQKLQYTWFLMSYGSIFQSKWCDALGRFVPRLYANTHCSILAILLLSVGQIFRYHLSAWWVVWNHLDWLIVWLLPTQDTQFSVLYVDNCLNNYIDIIFPINCNYHYNKGWGKERILINPRQTS